MEVTMRKSKVVEPVSQSNGTLNDTIARRAYELFEQRGCGHGYDLDDWLTAERFIQEAAATGGSPGKMKSKVVSMRKRKSDS
jgi:hypothetical protein